MKHDKKYYIKSIGLPLFVALIWGFSFIVQSKESCGLLAFIGGRSIFGVIFLFFLILFLEKGKVKKVFTDGTRENTKRLWTRGIVLGCILFVGQVTQQAGLYLGTEPGKAGFISALYVVLVPLFGIFFGKKTKLVTFGAALLALVGLYFICVKENFEIKGTDAIIIFSACAYAMHILFVSREVEQNDAVKLSFVQFITTLVLGLLGSFLFEENTFAGIRMDFMELLYLGIFSSGIAFTLQNVAEVGTNPTLVSIGFSMESVFSLVFSMLILHQELSLREYIGCGIMFLAVILANVFI